MSAPGLLAPPTRAFERRRRAHNDEVRLWLRLLTSVNLIEGELRRRMRDSFKTTLPRFDLMAQLDKAPDGSTLGALSTRLMVSNGNVTGIAERLVAEGLLDRRPAPHDRRAQIVRLTPEGRHQFQAMAQTHAAWVGELFADLSREEQAVLMRLLGKAKASAQRASQRGGTR